MEFLKKKYGPLPAWGWGVVGIAAVVFYLRYRASQATASAGSTTAASIPYPTTGGSSAGTTGSASGSTGTTGGYGSSLSDQIGSLTQDISALQGLNTALGLGPTGTPSPTPQPAQPSWQTLDLYQAESALASGLPVYGQLPGTNEVQQIQLPQGWYRGSGLNWQWAATGQQTPAGLSFFTPTGVQPGGVGPYQIPSTPTSTSGGLLTGGNNAPIQPHIPAAA